MSIFDALAALLTLTAGFAYANHRWLRQPASIALMAMTLALSIGLIALEKFGLAGIDPLMKLLDRIEFDEALLHGMLGALLFAGALHVPIAHLREQTIAVSTLALVGTLLSTFVVAGFAHSALSVLGVPFSFSYCLLFGAIVSPTDPIAVLGILRRAQVPRSMEIQISGESLFNDGVGVVVFTTVLGFISRGDASVTQTLLLFLRETVGGVLFGLASGYVVYRLLRSIDHYQTELLLTLSLVFGGYALAERLHVSAPLAAVVAGLLIGNTGRAHGMSDVTRDHLDKFWSLVDDVLNAVLFVLVGLEFVKLELTNHSILAGLLMIPSVLMARFVSVGVPIGLMRHRERFARGTIRILTWSGLRGGISVALALSTPESPEKALIVTMTYFVVAFSILVQGLTLQAFAKRFAKAEVHA